MYIIIRIEYNKYSSNNEQSIKITNLINDMKLYYVQKETIFEETCQLMICLNAYRHNDFQSFWRSQVHCSQSYNLINLIIQLFRKVILNNFESQDNIQYEIQMSQYQHDQIITYLNVILSFIQGGDVDSVLVIMQSNFLENIKYILEYTYQQNCPKRFSDIEIIQQGVNLGKFSLKTLNYDDVSELKNLALELLEHLIENDAKSTRRKKIVERLTFKVLENNFIRIYSQFLKAYGGEFTSNTADFLEPGFKIFALIQGLPQSIRLLKQSQTQQSEQLQLFAAAYSFFESNSNEIEVIENGQIRKVQFAELPHFKALNDEIYFEFESKIDRKSYQTKYISLMTLAESFNKRLQFEQLIGDWSQTSWMMSIVDYISDIELKLRRILLILTFIENFYLMTTYRNLQWLNETVDPVCMCIMFTQVFTTSLLCLFFIVKKKNYINWEIKQKIYNLQNSYQKDNFQSMNLLPDVTQQTKKLGFITTAEIIISSWLGHYTIINFVVQTPVWFIGVFYFEPLLALSLFDIFVQFPETKNVFRAFWGPRQKLANTLVIYIIFVYIFSIIANQFLKKEYNSMCSTTLGCFSVIWDTTHKGRVSKMFGTVNGYQHYLTLDDNYYLDWEDIFDFFYLIIVVSMLWTWTFTSLIIESYGTLRREANALANDKQNICMICNLDREQIMKKCRAGYDSHVKNEHYY